MPENLDATMQLLFMASRGDAKGVEDLLGDGIDVNSIDLDGRTALHIAACEGHVDVVKLLVGRRANIDARDRWGSTVCFWHFLCFFRLRLIVFLMRLILRKRNRTCRRTIIYLYVEGYGYGFIRGAHLLNSN